MDNIIDRLKEHIKEHIYFHLYEKKYLLEDENNTEEEIPNKQIPIIDKKQALEIMLNNKDKIFTVTYYKKDGSQRVLNGKLGVKKYLKGGELRYNPTEKGLLPIYDLKKQAYRMINVGGLTSLNINNQIYKIK